MKIVARILGLLAFWGGALTVLRPRTGWFSMLMWMPKLLAGALAPFFVVIGSVAVLVSSWHRDWWGLLPGFLGMLTAGNYVRRVVAPHDGFASAFGSDWESRISPELKPRLLAQRWTPFLCEKTAVSCQEDIIYGYNAQSGTPLLADIWQPAPEIAPTGLAVVYVHGGAWRYGTKNMRTATFFKHLARQGHVVMDVAYTLAPLAAIPQMVVEIKCAISWLKMNTAVYGINPERIVLMGGSAGGHLALLTAYSMGESCLQAPATCGDSSVCAVVSFYGPPDFRALQDAVGRGYGRVAYSRLTKRLLHYFDSRFKVLSGIEVDTEIEDPLRLLADVVGGLPAEVPEAYRLTSPITYVGPHCPPTLLIQNTHDFSGMMPEVMGLAQALRVADVPVVYVELPNTEHAFDLVWPQISPAAQSAFYDVDRFLALMVN
ncbi:MAG: alpha/beta hydrolase [Anaerolineales bacterium]|nr:alpha/beta hydrolase [Anaerolineales bacterium]